MSAITTKMIADLRARTGAGMMDCKRALEETGNVEKAVELLRQKGQAKGDKRAGRAAAEGTVAAHVTPDGKAAGMVELNSETDFVARNPEFQNLARELAREVAEGRAAPSEGKVKALSGKTGENVVLRRTARLPLEGSGLLETYVHFNGQVGVLLELGAPSGAAPALRTLAKDLTLHIASTRPIAVAPADVPADVVERERRIFTAQVAAEGKPEAVRPKIVEGKLRKFYEDRVLLEQPFVKDDKVRVKDLLKQAAATAGADVSVRRFAVFAVGEE
ncbi:MAG TPA: translation elongation factor Ts [Gemmatimonadales bacterium]